MYGIIYRWGQASDRQAPKSGGPAHHIITEARTSQGLVLDFLQGVIKQDSASKTNKQTKIETVSHQVYSEMRRDFETWLSCP